MVFYKAGCSWGVRVGLMGSVSRGVNLKGDGGISWQANIIVVPVTQTLDLWPVWLVCRNGSACPLGDFPC